MSEVQEQAVQNPFPQTVSELEVLIAASLGKILSIPENAAAIAQGVLNTASIAINEKRDNAMRNATRPVVTKTYYKGAWRATIGESIAEGDDLLDVSIEEKTENGWSLVELNEQAKAMFNKLVLSQSAQPGDVFYVTTNRAIDNAFEEATDMIAGDESINLH